MKKALSVLLSTAMLSSVFAIGTSAALPTYLKSQPETVLVEDFESAPVGKEVEKCELDTVVGGFSTTSGSQRAIAESGDEEYGKVVKMTGFYQETVKEDESVTIIKGASSVAGFGEVTGAAKYTVEFDINPQYASAAPNVVIPWGNDTGNPAVLVFSPDLFTDIDLQVHATNANHIALLEAADRAQNA